MILLLEKIIRGGMSSVMGDRYLKSDENKKFLYVDANDLDGWAMSQSLSYDELGFHKNNNLEDILKTPDGNVNGSFLEVALSYPDFTVEKSKKISFCPEKKYISKRFQRINAKK